MSNPKARLGVASSPPVMQASVSVTLSKMNFSVNLEIASTSLQMEFLEHLLLSLRSCKRDAEAEALVGLNQAVDATEKVKLKVMKADRRLARSGCRQGSRLSPVVEDCLSDSSRSSPDNLHRGPHVVDLALPREHTAETPRALPRRQPPLENFVRDSEAFSNQADEPSPPLPRLLGQALKGVATPRPATSHVQKRLTPRSSVAEEQNSEQQSSNEQPAPILSYREVPCGKVLPDLH
eukprot:TRINITY_DN66578_c0_g1_i1.p1 TRINITY_DN66578_c0_g1~~TRINITY_DN66578_c0_g1_i1.p1  ORF type:complete len:236 (+),score=38.43 TRINITY_DN66578_c0_g1_i1:65-772(+)